MGIKLFVGNLGRTTTSEQLREMFSPYGTVKWADVALDGQSGACRGFRFVQMGTQVRSP
jgi:RNA recognition motif-containing protein